MQFTVHQRFFFDAAHTLERAIETESSRRIHGHTYIAEITLAGTPDPASGMLVDLAFLRRQIAELRDQLDHRFLDEVEGIDPNLGPTTSKRKISNTVVVRDQPQMGWKSSRGSDFPLAPYEKICWMSFAPWRCTRVDICWNFRAMSLAS